MSQADGTILIDTEINADGMKAGGKEVEDAVRRMASSVDNLGTKAKTSLNKQVDAFAKMNTEYAVQSRKVDELRNKVAEYGKQKIPTAEYKEIQDQIAKATQQMEKLKSAQEKYIATGGKSSSGAYKRRQYDIEELAKTIQYAEGELQDLEDTGKAFTLGSKTKQAAADMKKLAVEEQKLSNLNNRLGTSYSSIKGTVNDYRKNLLKTNDAQKKADKSGKKLSKSLKDTGKSANKANFGIGKMLGTSLLFSFVFQAISGATNAIKDGFSNLAKYSGSTNNSISMLLGSLERLKNSLATAFAPILNIVAPILTKFIDLLSAAANYVSMFFAALSGKSTYTKAIAVQKDYAASLEDTAGGAKDAAKEMEGYLSPLDEINKMDKADLSGGASGGSGTDSGPLFEEAPIDNKFLGLLDSLSEKLNDIKKLFTRGFWDGLQGYQPILEDLKKDFSSIGRYLTDIFTDADVAKAAKNFSRSFVYNVGKIAGSFSLIGLSIAEAIVGGIESFLSQNSGRIKVQIASIFNVGAEIFDVLGTLTQTVADIISSVLGSQLSQNLVGNLLGIFNEIFMGVTNLALNLGRDLLNLITGPLVENKELIKTSLMETLGPIQTITQSIEEFVQNTVDKVTTLYNEHVKPFIDSLSEGIGDVLGVLLDGYNNYIAPILDEWGNKFDEILNGPVGEALDSFLYLAGEVFDMLKLLWENLLLPFITWVVDTVVPSISPIISTIGNIVLNLFAVISDVVGGIFDILGGFLEFFSGIFHGDIEEVIHGIEKMVDGLAAVVKGPVNAIIGILNALIDGIVKALNLAIEKLNGLKFTVPDWIPFIGGKKFDLDLKKITAPQIPYLASGAVIPPNREFLAVLGDQKHGNNLEMPENLLRKILREENGNSKAGGNYSFTAQINRRTLFEEVIREAQMQQMRTGKNPFETI